MSVLTEVDESALLQTSHIEYSDCVLGRALFCCTQRGQHESSFYGEYAGGDEVSIGESPTAWVSRLQAQHESWVETEQELSFASSTVLDVTSVLDATMASIASPVGSPEAGEQVFLHLYDLNETFCRMNNVGVDMLGFGGALHVGVEVLGSEWSYGMKGVSVSSPKQNQHYSYRQTVSMGRTTLKRREIVGIILSLQEQWCGADYDVFSRNCASFCSSLCEQLGVGELPAWVTRLPEVVGKLPAMRMLAGSLARGAVQGEAHRALDCRGPISPLQRLAMEEGGECTPPAAVVRVSASPVRCRFSGSPVYTKLPVQARCEAFRVEKEQRQEQLPGDDSELCSPSSSSSSVKAGEAPCPPPQQQQRGLPPQNVATSFLPPPLGLTALPPGSYPTVGVPPEWLAMQQQQQQQKLGIGGGMGGLGGSYAPGVLHPHAFQHRARGLGGA